MLHTKLRRNPFDPSGEIPVESNKSYLLSLGFRKLTITPIFSRCLNGCDKTKYVREIGDDYENYFYCSFYGSNYFPPAPALLYDLHRSEASPLMVGELAKCDSMHIVLERILLTGYPFKINRRRSTIRFMFFNPKDVKFFKPIELRTKLGLRVHCD